jgi:hypothetical protein
VIILESSKKKYEKKRVVKHVSFLKEKDAEILNYIKDFEFSTYVKKLIREDMKK